jgi:hypothetical protein
MEGDTPVSVRVRVDQRDAYVDRIEAVDDSAGAELFEVGS